LNFYPHHIGDYLTATAHLTWLEDCAYRRLLDVYYSREQAIPADVAQACRLVRATGKDERKAVETVLREFFTLEDKGWTHGRCDKELTKAHEAAERARLNGLKGGRPVKPRGNPEITQPVPVGNPEISKSQAPITNPITNTKKTPPTPKGEPEGFAEWYAEYPRKEARADAARAFAKVPVPLQTLLAALEWQRKLPAWTKDKGQFIPLPASYLNAARWEDERPDESVTTPTNPAAIFKPEPALTPDQLATNRANAAAQLARLKQGGLSAIRTGAE
jgi:uncharacterized protein YdaU (DUF1376 family)